MKQKKEKKRVALILTLTKTLSVLILMVLVLAGCYVKSTNNEEENPTENELTQVFTLAEEAAPEAFGQSDQTIAPLSNGGFAVVWTNGWRAQNLSMLQYLNAQGTPLTTTPLQVSTGNSDQIVVISRPEGGVFVAYQQNEFPYSIIRVQAYDQNRVPLWQDGVIASLGDDPNQAHNEPYLVAGQSGDVYLLLKYSNFDKNWIKCQRITASGTCAWGAEGIVISPRMGFVTYPMGVADGAGGLYAFWMDMGDYFKNPSDPVRLMGQHLTPTGSKTMGPEAKTLRTLRTTSTNYYHTSMFTVSSDPSGNAIVAWNNYGDPSLSTSLAMVEKINAQGHFIWPNGVNAGPQNEDRFVTGLINTNDGGLIVAIIKTGHAFNSFIALSRINSNGEKTWGESGIDIFDPAVNIADFNLYGLPKGNNFTLCWTSGEVRADGYVYYNIKTARISSSGTLLDPRGGIPINVSEYSEFIRGMVYNPSSRKTFLSVEDMRNTIDPYDSNLFVVSLGRTTSTLPTPLPQHSSQARTPFNPQKKYHFPIFHTPASQVVTHPQAARTWK